ncbi:MAG TPA: DnaA/Hda family protein [Gemmatimonadaceae bacterium]|nr:DnaA/Hda family protein [Gemmatimonadaceae bacterium]
MRLDARLRFENLIVGAGNRLAVAAARAVAESPGAVYNPLFVYGDTGLGKTHLLCAVGHLVQTLQPGADIEYVSLDEFVEQLHAAVSAGQVDAFSRRHERVDVLLIDDLQFLTGRRETQAEFLRIFERMQAGSKQVMLTSDRPPQEIADVDERLLGRLSGGLIVDVSAPDFETRLAILRAIRQERRLTISSVALEELAGFEFENVRELQGALNRLVAHSTGSHPVQRARTPAAAAATDNPFDDFLSEITTVVQHHVESWQARLREAIQYWNGEGYRTGTLERALARSEPPDVAQLLATFTAAVEQLRELEQSAVREDPALGGNSVFRDPDRAAEAEELVARALAGETPPTGPSPAFARDTYEVGTSNQLAAHAADAVVAEPGTKYTPLVIFGPSGVGKTHLLHAIGNALAAADVAVPPVVAVVHAQQFVDELVTAIQANTLNRWRGRYRALDALLIDDVQFLAGKERTEEEFFLLFNSLAAGRKQIVISCDRPPGEITGLEARLRSRLEGGLAAPIQPPDRVLRERLYARYLKALGRAVDAALLAVLAEPVVQSVREIIGVVNRLGALADARGVELSPALARAELGAARPTPFPGVRSVPRTDGRRDAAFLDHEKVVWEWPDVSARVLEEWR